MNKYMNKDFKIIAIRNYIHRELLEKTKLLHIPELRICGDNWMYGLRLLEKLFITDNIQDEYDYIVFIDEDCLVFNENKIYDIISDMIDNNSDICGVPDGGGTLARRIHRSDVPNLFFTIIKTEKLRKLPVDKYNNYIIPCNLFENNDNTSCDTFEPYYKMLCFMIYELNMKFMKLVDITNNEDRSSVVNYDGERMCIHTWYSRKYNSDEEIRNYINKVIDKALEEKYE